MNFSKALWERIKACDPQAGLHAVGSGEGAISRIDRNSNFYFLIGGSWSHVFLHFGIHYNNVSRLISDAMYEIDDFYTYRRTFANKLVGLFNQPVGNYCLSERDLGVYCPQGSQVADVEFVLREMESVCDRKMSISPIEEAVEYVWREKIIDIGSRFYLPASCVIARERDIFEDSVLFFQSEPRFRCNRAYQIFAEKLRAMFP